MFRKKVKKAKTADASQKRKRNTNVIDESSTLDSEVLSIETTTTSKPRKLNTFGTSNRKTRVDTTTNPTTLSHQQVQSDRSVVPKTYAGDATYETQIDTAKDRDARAILERNIKINAERNSDDEGTGGTAAYKGAAGYKNYITKKESQVGMNKYTGTQGPIRAQTWARSICRFDYQPDVCKDYKETGYCGYGDSCIYLHDRGDYKSGWQIEQEYNKNEAQKKQRLMDRSSTAAPGDDDDDDNQYVIHSDSDEDEQFACTICREPFKNAVTTLCGCNFCEACAIKQYKKSTRCFNCRKQTSGIFNVAEKLRLRESTSEEKPTTTTTAASKGTWEVHDSK